MNWHELTMRPRDLLFFRDAKPMEASSVGCGANWPLPNLMHDSLINAMKKQWPASQEWEFSHKHPNAKDRREDLANLRFGGLQTTGVFPCRDEMLFFPRPADLEHDGNQMVLQCFRGSCNLPPYLKIGCAISGEPSKKRGPEWITEDSMRRYFDGEKLNFEKKTQPLFDCENRTGIAIDPESGAAMKSKLYLAEYLRLRENVTLKGFAACESVCRGKNATDVLEKFFTEESSLDVVIGGQQGVAQVTKHPCVESLAATLPGGDGIGCYLKWVLLTPAVFDSGWLPDWVNAESGEVLLPSEKPERRVDESRADWRLRFTESLKARLIAVRMEKSQVISGWNLRKAGPRPTRLAVPAGMVYWFKADTPADAAALCAALQGRFKSNYYGEKGFGLGICKVFENIEIKGE